MSESDNNFTKWVSLLARTHSPVMLLTAKREGLLAEDALDAVQDAFSNFLTLPQARLLADEAEDGRGVLITLTRNIARNMRRRHFRSRPHSTEFTAEKLSAELTAVDDAIVQLEQHVALYGCINKLAQVQRQIVIARMIQEASNEEVARELELTPAHTAVLLHRAKKKLLDCLNEGYST